MDIKDLSEKSFDNRQALETEIAKALTDRAVETDEPQGFRGEGIYFGQQPPKMRADEYLDAAKGWVYGCITRIADALSSIDIELYEIKGEDITEVETHPAIDVLDRVNSHTTRLDHFALTQKYLELTGEAPWFVDRGENATSEPQSILLLRPDRLTIIENDDKSSSNPIKGYKYRVDAATDIEIKFEELIFLKYPDTTNQFRGSGTLYAAAKTVDIDNFSEDYNKRFFYNSARPDMVLQSDQKLTSSQRQTLQTSIRKLYQGADKSHKTLILESGLEAKPFSMSAKDMDFLAQQQYDMSKIFSIFGVPKSIMAVSDDVNLANAKVGEYVFMKYTVIPKLKRIVAQLNEFYLPMFKGTENMFFSFKNPLPEDTDAKVKMYDSALGKGYMTINEVRALENLPDVGEAGDTLFIPFGVQPIDTAANPPELPSPDATQNGLRIIAGKRKKLTRELVNNSGGGFARAKKGMKVINSRKAAKAAEQKKIKELESKIDQLAIATVKELVKDKRQAKKEIAKQKQANKEAMLNEYVGVYLAASKNYERAFAVGMDTVFEQQRKKLLKKLPKKSKDINIDDWQIDEEEEAKFMVRVFNPLTKQVIKTSGDRAIKLVGESYVFDQASKPVQDYLKTRLFDFSFEVNQETNRLLANALKDGVANGESIPKLRDRVKEVFDGMEDYRSERIARSEVIRASNFAALEAYDQTGVVEKAEWLATPDDRADEECLALDGKVVKLGGGFSKNDYDGIVTQPPLHPNCRCTLIPVVS